MNHHQHQNQAVVLQLATFNIRNTTDRYAERLPVLRRAVRDLGADVAGFQEVNYLGGQPEMLCEATGVPAATECAFRGESPHLYPLKPHDPSFRIDGNLIVCRPTAGTVLRHSTLRLSDHRVAHRVVLRLSTGRLLSFINTHMHHELAEGPVREIQARMILDWAHSLDTAESIDYSVLVGDFNTPPAESAYSLIAGRGYVSAYKQRHGHEPASTFPSGLQAETMDTDPPMCLDYVWVKARQPQQASCTVEDAWLAANQPAPADDTIYPSDHIAVVARVCFS